MAKTILDIKDVENLFKQAGLTVTVGGCGCCGSPSLKVAHESGEFDEECVSLYMHELAKAE